jgi:hypothetical protein
MGVPTTTTAPQNVYRVIDDYGTTAGPSGGNTGATSGQPMCPDFTAPTLASAAQVAYLLSSVYQRPVRLCPLSQQPPYTLITGIGANNALTVVPSGIGY